MKISYYATILAALAVMVGCKQSNGPISDTTTNTAELSRQARDSMNSAKDSAIQAKNDFLAAMDKKIQILDAQIKELGDKSAGYQDDAKAQADKTLADLRAQRTVVQQKFDDMKQAGQNAWDNTKAAFSNAWDNMEKAYDDAKAKFK